MKVLKWMVVPLFVGMMVTTAFMHPATNEITIEAGEESIVVETREHTVGEALKAANIHLSDHVQVNLGLEERIEEGMVITVEDVISVSLEMEGEIHQLYTAKPHVQAVLDHMEIELKEHDRVHPAPMNTLKPNMEIRVIRVEKVPDNQVEEIAYQSITRYSDDLEPGEAKKVQEGMPGRQIVQRATIYHDGELTGSKVENRHVLQAPVDEIIEKGKENVLVTSSGELIHYKEVITMEATAYDAGYQSTGKSPGHPQYGITRSGTRVRPGVVAVDPNVIPLGSKLYVQSANGGSDYGLSDAEDTGGAIKGNRIDLYYESRSEALRFGRQQVKVYVLE